MPNKLLKYLSAFKKLHLDRAHGIAPHKPILLLSLLQAFSNKIYTDSKIYITPELVALFKSNWNLLVITNHDCRISYPFYYLKSDKFWKLIPKPGFENINQMGSVMKSFSNLNAMLEYALIDDDLLELAQDTNSNNILKELLLNEYFLKTKNNFSNSNIEQQQLFYDIEEKILREDAVEYKTEIKMLIAEQDEEEIFLRGCIFKREIHKIYNNSCCISGMKIDAIVSVSMIDACHIIPFSESYNDTITNGIALCPNLHRAFDRGLIAIDENYKVIISKAFEEGITNYSIKAFKNQQILLPKQNIFYPLIDNFNWHRKNTFKN